MPIHIFVKLLFNSYAFTVWSWNFGLHLILGVITQLQNSAELDLKFTGYQISGRTEYPVHLYKATEFD